MRSITFFAVICLIVGFSACYNDNLDELTIGGSSPNTSTCNSDGTMLYATHVVPVLQTNCGTQNSCHNAQSSSGVNLSTYNSVKTYVTNGTLISSITWVGSASRMPKGSSQMSNCNITIIQKWVDAGALDN